MLVPGAVAAQSADPEAPSAEWNSDRVRGLVERAILARQHAYADSSLKQFRADAEGHVYFVGAFQGEREVVKADQFALDARWQAPDRSIQTIIGRRDEKRLPTSIRYHIDHLALVLDNFGDRIRIGDGDEVENVLHPAADGALEFYEFRLVDSLEVSTQERQARLYELEVRPAETNDPGIVGSVFVDRASGAIARMRVTFTNTAYRDPQLLGIVLDLQSALWEGRYWLPSVQHLEITRAMSWLDFPLETVIRARIEVFEYFLNEEPSYGLTSGQYVASMPNSVLDRFEGWRSPLYGGPIGDDERSDEELRAAVAGASKLVRQRGLRGGERLQVAFPNASAGLRARRAEGLLIGAGGTYWVDDLTRLSFWGGYPTGLGDPEASLGVSRSFGDWSLSVEGLIQTQTDVGDIAASGATKTLALLAEGEDYEDPYVQNGVRVGARKEHGSVELDLGLSLLGQRSAELVVRDAVVGSRPLRPVRPIDEGDLAVLDLGVAVDLGRAIGARWEARAKGEFATASIGDFGYSQAELAIAANSEGFSSVWGWSSDLRLGMSGGNLPSQRLFLLGGRGTVPGYAFRAWGGDRMALWRGDVSRSVLHPWVRVRLSGSAGWTDLGSSGGAAAERFGVLDTGRIRGSAGLGVGLFYDVLRVDVMRGWSDSGSVSGDWVLLIALDPFLWDIL